MNSYSVRTDLAIESAVLMDKKESEEIPGVSMKTAEEDGVLVTHVEIFSREGSDAMGKPLGNYITIEADAMKDPDVTFHETVMKVAAENLRKLFPENFSGLTLVVGLGNWHITPDALGPKVIAKVLVTNHLQETLPEEIDESVRAVAAITPGVMGITGIETGEIIRGIVERVHPDLVICIDALAARKASRINATIQMSDAGLSPGAGVGNKRMELNEKTLGVPVIAIGVPTVVDAATLVNDTMDRLLAEMIAQTEKGTPFYEMLDNLDPEEKYQLIVEILNPYVGNMFVTPKEVDAVVDRLANIIANSVNIALHPGITMEDINRYTY